jgi:hypothetical protein
MPHLPNIIDTKSTLVCRAKGYPNLNSISEGLIVGVCRGAAIQSYICRLPMPGCRNKRYYNETIEVLLRSATLCGQVAI